MSFVICEVGFRILRILVFVCALRVYCLRLCVRVCVADRRAAAMKKPARSWTNGRCWVTGFEKGGMEESKGRPEGHHGEGQGGRSEMGGKVY